MPPTSSANIEMARRSGLIGIMLACLAYGTHLALFCVTFRHIYRFLRPRTKLIWTILAYIVLLFVLATVGIALQIRWSTLAFVDRSSTTPEFLVTQVNNKLSLAKTAIFILINLISDAMLVWRFYAVFLFDKKRVLVPILVIFSNIVIASLFLRQFAAISINPWASTPTLHIIIYLSLSVSLNVFLTVLIIFRLFHMDRGNPSNTSSGTCARVSRMFAECVLLYITTALVFIGLCVERSHGQNLILPVLGQIQALPPLLLIMRVAQDKCCSRTGDDLIIVEQIANPRRSRPALTLKLDSKSFQTHKSPCFAPLSIPSPLPSAKVKYEPASAHDMLPRYESLIGNEKGGKAFSADSSTPRLESSLEYLPV